MLSPLSVLISKSNTLIAASSLWCNNCTSSSIWVKTMKGQNRRIRLLLQNGEIQTFGVMEYQTCDSISFLALQRIKCIGEKFLGLARVRHNGGSKTMQTILFYFWVGDIYKTNTIIIFESLAVWICYNGMSGSDGNNSWLSMLNVILTLMRTKIKWIRPTPTCYCLVCQEVWKTPHHLPIKKTIPLPTSYLN